jgi:hypothetical protein
LLDGFEVTYGFNPLVPGEQGLDPDGDGLSNLDEQTYQREPAGRGHGRRRDSAICRRSASAPTHASRTPTATV